MNPPMNTPTYPPPAPAPTGPAPAPAPAAPAPAGPPAGSSVPVTPPAPAAAQAPRPVSPAPAPEKPPVVVGAPLKAGKRRARLVVRRIDPWSVLKFSLLFSLCLLVVFVVAVGALYFALDSLGVFDSVNKALVDLTSTGEGEGATGGVQVVFSATTVLTGAAVVGAINVVIITAICTLGAFLYNLCSDVVGGIEVTLAERE